MNNTHVVDVKLRIALVSPSLVSNSAVIVLSRPSQDPHFDIAKPNSQKIPAVLQLHYEHINKDGPRWTRRGEALRRSAART